MNNRAICCSWIGAGVVALFLALPSAAASVNKSIKIEAGSPSDGASSVNGSITVGAGAVVTGEVKTVNGAIRVDENASIEDASTVNGSLRIGAGVRSQSLGTVNGSIRVDDNVTVDGAVRAVNGRIEVGGGSRIAGDLSNVNGEIRLVGCEVGGDLSTVSGDITLSDGAVVEGDLVVEKPGSWSWGKSKSREPEIVIGPVSKVLGTIRLEREVKLYISESADVGGVDGVMTLSDAVRFSGERP
jgi:hypothetical protein